MNKPLLSILIPTFNRKRFLVQLLEELERQVSELPDPASVEVIVADNCSSDFSYEAALSIASRTTGWRVYQRSSNIGPDANMLQLLRDAHGAYRWFIGDDDKPRSGLIRFLVQHLQLQSSDLLYLPSEWLPDIYQATPPCHEEVDFTRIGHLKCASRMHIWTTFISSWVFSYDRLSRIRPDLEEISELVGSCFIQLGWILPFLVDPEARIEEASGGCILATSGNTGGYHVAQAFLVNYPRIVASYARHSFLLRRLLIGGAVRSYLPSLILALREGSSFRNAGSLSGIAAASFLQLWTHPFYWLLCLPLLLLPSHVVNNLYSRARRIRTILLS